MNLFRAAAPTLVAVTILVGPVPAEPVDYATLFIEACFEEMPDFEGSEARFRRDGIPGDFDGSGDWISEYTDEELDALPAWALLASASDAAASGQEPGCVVMIQPGTEIFSWSSLTARLIEAMRPHWETAAVAPDCRVSRDIFTSEEIRTCTWKYPFGNECASVFFEMTMAGYIKSANAYTLRSCDD